MKDFIEEYVQDQLLRDSMLFSGLGSPGVLIFYAGGALEENAYGITRWEFKNDRVPVLLLYRDEDLIVNLTLQNSGEWKGRLLGSRGFCILRGTSAIWKRVSKPGKYAEYFEKKKSIEDIIEEENNRIKWEDYQLDLSAHKNVIPIDSVTAIAIAACNRPAYFEKTVQSIARNPDIGNYPVFVFIDYADSTDLMEDQAKIARKYISHSIIIKRAINFGCGRNLIDIRRQLFDKLDYSRVFIFEDDMIVSPTYLQFCMNLLRWGQENYSNVGAVQGWSFCTISRDDKDRNWNVVVPTVTNWWGYLMTKEAWLSIRPGIYRYEEKFLQEKYQHRPHSDIKKWFQEIAAEERKTTKAPFADYNNTLLGEQYQKYAKNTPTGQDAATMHFFYNRGWDRIAPLVNRAQYIGKSGIHMQPSQFYSSGFDAVKLHLHPKDSMIKKFSLIPQIVGEKSPLKNFEYIRN